ncbi:unnamed protein product, partial [Gulo gulo]
SGSSRHTCRRTQVHAAAAGRGPSAPRTPPGAPLPSCPPCNCDGLKPQTSVCTSLHPPDCTIAQGKGEDGHGQRAGACRGLMDPGPSGSRTPCGSPGHFLGHCGTCPTAGSSSSISTRTPGQLPSSSYSAGTQGQECGKPNPRAGPGDCWGPGS